ncbi:unnamed protein product [Cuscuta epithymum]|uniref:HTH myb-type domain-containing protein n=1 Tax=Cuscuta epithymum TaxID=186058 RepID=A0AAV0F0T1_9ASTE|nr:unnamed protein product [Cuscuta epithymum]
MYISAKMILEIANNKNKNPWLVGSGDTKPRLKWTPELHHRFVDAVSQLGGAEKATPKSLMRKMNIQGITLYHLKSHLQKFRLGKGQNPQPRQDSKQEDYIEHQSQSPADNSDEAQGQMNDTETAQALRIQMEVHRKLQEQIEVQRHIHQRIEAQGKYLQSVIKMAHETLSGCGSSIEVELAKAEISKLKLMVDMECFSCSSSGLTEKECSVRKDTECLGRMGYEPEAMEEAGKQVPENSSVELPLMEMHPSFGNRLNGYTSERKRSQCTSSDNNCNEKPCDLIFKANTYDQNLKTIGFLKNPDLNKKCLRDFDSCHPKDIDLNCNGLERFNGYI